MAISKFPLFFDLFVLLFDFFGMIFEFLLLEHKLKHESDEN